VVKFVFYPSKLKKEPFLANNFKIKGAKVLPCPPPSNAHVLKVSIDHCQNKTCPPVEEQQRTSDATGSDNVSTNAIGMLVIE